MLALCVVAFVSGTSRGFSGFGAADLAAVIVDLPALDGILRGG
ncbi:hypothetical protein [Bradyrhizobium lablabi]|nr:hypothetical protein [Bradyrhizobium lablabi]